MGLLHLPIIRDYWSISKEWTEIPAASNVMSRLRFEQIIKCLHFSDNDKYDGNDRLYKISAIVSAFNEISSTLYRPGKLVCIDESLVPFRGNIIRQRILKTLFIY